jgi:hypothetical protein
MYTQINIPAAQSVRPFPAFQISTSMAALQGGCERDVGKQFIVGLIPERRKLLLILHSCRAPLGRFSKALCPPTMGSGPARDHYQSGTWMEHKSKLTIRSSPRTPPLLLAGLLRHCCMPCLSHMSVARASVSPSCRVLTRPPPSHTPLRSDPCSETPHTN